MRTIPPLSSLRHPPEDQPRRIASTSERPPSQVHTQTEQRPYTATTALFANVLWSWSGQALFILGGFLLPRAIDRMHGHAILGVWDLAWALVAYLNLIDFGVSSSVNRFVARHLAEDDTVALNRTIASVMYVQLAIGTAILLLAGGLCFSLRSLWGAQLADLLPETQRVVFFLALASAISFSFGAFSGVLTGCHRWDIYNGIYGGVYLATLVGMLLALWGSGRLYHMAAVYAGGSLLHVIANGIAAHRVCPALKIRSRNADTVTMSSMLRFGGKTFLNGLARSFLYQATGLCIATYLGPAVLALYSRPLALVSQVRTLSTKFAHTLTPIASELHATESRTTLQQLATTMARAGAALALPPVLFLSILGGCVLEIWMGKAYRDDFLPLVLALGHLCAIANLPLQTILIGMNSHGRPAFVSVLSAVACAIAAWVTLALFHGGMYLVATCVALTLTVGDGAFVTAYTCRRLHLPVRSFITNVWSVPLLCGLPFALWLLICRASFSPLNTLIWGGIGGGAIVAFTYFRWLLPPEVGTRLAGHWRIRLLALFQVKGETP